MTKSIRRKDKRNVRLPAGIIIASSIAYINRGRKLIVLHDFQNIVSFFHACVAGTEMTGKIMPQIGCF